jgi:hypothetical protein
MFIYSIYVRVKQIVEGSKRGTASTRALTLKGREEFAEKLGFRCPAPKGASDFEELTAPLKRSPDTKQSDALIRNVSFSANC